MNWLQVITFSNLTHIQVIPSAGRNVSYPYLCRQIDGDADWEQAEREAKRAIYVETQNLTHHAPRSAGRSPTPSPRRAHTLPSSPSLSDAAHATIRFLIPRCYRHYCTYIVPCHPPVLILFATYWHLRWSMYNFFFFPEDNCICHTYSLLLVK